MIFVGILESVVLQIVLHVFFRDSKVFVVLFKTSDVRYKLVNELGVLALSFPLI